MELEEMKSLWEDMSHRVEKLELINEKNIMEMTQSKYQRKFSTLLKYEWTGTVICYGTALFLLINFHKLDSTLLLICGIALIIFLLVMPLFSLGFLTRLKNLDFSNANYKDMIGKYENSKKRVILIQQLSIPFSAFVFLASMPVFSKVLGNQDFFETLNVPMYIFIAVLFVGVLLFARWGYGCYKRITAGAGDILKELED